MVSTRSWCFTLAFGPVSSAPGEPGDVPFPLAALIVPFPLHLDSLVAAAEFAAASQGFPR